MFNGNKKNSIYYKNYAIITRDFKPVLSQKGQSYSNLRKCDALDQGGRFEIEIWKLIEIILTNNTRH